MARKRFFGSDEPTGQVAATARVDADAAALARRLKRGEIAVVDALDLDRRTAEALIERRPAAVLNARASISGRYPSGGPRALVDAGIPLVDQFGSDLLTVRDGDKVRLDGPELFRGDDRIASGVVQTPDLVDDATRQAVDGMNVQLATFTANAMDHVAHDAPLLLEGTGLPYTEVKMSGQQVLVVGPGAGHDEQIRSIRGYLAERRPIVIAVGEAADAALRHAYAPSIIIGNIESVSDEALKATREVILHDPSGADPGVSRAEALGVKYREVESSVTSADLAVLMANAGGATVVITAGMEARLTDFLERGQEASASTFLARLVAGRTLVDASSLPYVYKHRYSPWVLVALVASAVFLLANAIAITPGGSAWLRDIVPGLGLFLGGTP